MGCSAAKDDWDNYRDEIANKPRGLSGPEADRLMRAIWLSYMDAKGLGKVRPVVAPGWMDKNGNGMAKNDKGEVEGPEPVWMTLKEVLQAGMGGTWPPMTGLTDDDGYFDHSETCTQAVFAKTTDGSHLLLSCRGSSSGADWTRNTWGAKTRWEPTIDSKDGNEDKACSCCRSDPTDPHIKAQRKQLGPQGKVHRGWYEAFLSMTAQIDKLLVEPCLQEGTPVKKVSIVGHSLGGVLATYSLVYFLQKCRGSADPKDSSAAPTIVGRGIFVTCFTVGSPRVGDEAFRTFSRKQTSGLRANKMFKHYRVVLDRDIVATIPPHRFGWLHQGRVCKIAQDENHEFHHLMFKHDGIDQTVENASEVVNLRGHWKPPTCPGLDYFGDHQVPAYFSALFAAGQKYEEKADDAKPPHQAVGS